jgi:4-amino-4-deoxy-L-arabinose transferase-like glycosyltransferase
MTATELRRPEEVTEELDLVIDLRVPARRRVRLAALWPVLTSGLLAYLGSVLVFPLLSVNHDEPAYLLQAEALRHGDLTIKAPAHAAAFIPWLSTLRHGQLVFKYTPFHAAFLALGRTLFGSYRASMVLIAMACVASFGFLARTVMPTRRTSLVATWLFALSPLVIIQSATYLSYLSSLTFLLLCLGSYFRAVRSGSERWWAVAGATGAIAFACRPFDAVIVLAPVIAHLSWLLYRRRVAWKPVAILAAAAAPFLALLAWLNFVMSGSPLTLPFTMLDPLDRLGFGWRSLHPSNIAIWFGPRQALEGLWMHVLWFPVFLCGGPALLLVATRARFRSLSTPMRVVAATAITFPVGYLFFWGSYGMSHVWQAHPISYLGPFYWLPVVVPFTLLGAIGLRSVHIIRPWIAIALVAVMLVFDAGTVAHAVDRNLEYTAQARALSASRPVVPAGEQQVVFVPQIWGPYLMHPITYTTNRLSYDGPIVYALDRGRDNFPVMAQFPDRVPYRMRVKGNFDDNPDSRPKVRVEPIANLTAPAFDVEVTIRNPTERANVLLQVLRHGREDWLVLDQSSTRGRTYDVRFRVTPDELTPQTRTLRHEVHALPKKKVGLPFTISAIFSPTPSFARRTVVEWLVWDRTDSGGNLVLQAPFDARRAAKWPHEHWVWDRQTTVVTVKVREIHGDETGPWIDVRPPG